MKAHINRPGEKGGVWGKQGFGGYPGVKNTARQIIEYIPIKEWYVEPFAGLGRTAEFIQCKHMVLNDKGDYAVNYLRKNFPNAYIIQKDFMWCIDNYDSNHTVFFIDPPWKTSVYDENALTFCDRKAVEYYTQLFTRFHTMKADWILASGVNDKIGDLMRETAEKNNWFIITVETRRRVILGQKAKTLLMSSKPFIKHRAFSVTMDGFL